MKTTVTTLYFLFLSLYFTNISAQEAKPSQKIVKGVTAKNLLSGLITDAHTGTPLAGASIYLSDLKVGAIAAENGLYKIQNLPTGRYLVEVSYLGYGSLVVPVELEGSLKQDFKLSPSVVENEAVTVTGTFTSTQVNKSPIPVTIIKKKDLLANSSTNLIDALSKSPGVSQIATGPAISKPTIRGLGYNRLVVVNDGVRQEGQQWGDEHGIEIDEYSVNKVEILKGPASLMYGSDALAGVINIMSDVPVEEGSVKGNLFSNYQSNNGLIGVNGNIAGNLGGFNWNAYASHKSAHDYKNKYDGRVLNSKFFESNYGGYAGINKSWGYSHIAVSSYDQTVGLIEGDRDETTGRFLKLTNNGGLDEEETAGDEDFRSRTPLIPYQRIKHFKVSADNNFKLRGGRLGVIVGYQRNQRQEFGNVIEPDEQELYFDLRTINYNVQYHLPYKNNWQTSIGINGMQQENTNKGEEALIPNYDLFDIGGFLYSKKSFDKLTLSGGVRYDIRTLSSRHLEEGSELKFEAFSRNFSNISGSIGLSYKLSEPIILKFNVARGFRAPSIPELASNGAHEGTNRYEYGTRNLKSEKSFQLDGGFDFNTEHVSFSTNVFYNRINDFIYYRKLAAIDGGDSTINDNIAFSFDQHNAYLYGAEFNLDIHPHPLDWLHLENTFTLVKGRLSEMQDGSNNLPFIPAARFTNYVRADFLRKGKTVRNLYASIELDNTFSQNDPFTGYNTETRTSGYSLLNAGLGADIINKGKTLFSLYIVANNITDVAYQNHLSRLKYTAENAVTGRTGVFNMGRNFSFKVNIPLIFRKPGA